MGEISSTKPKKPTPVQPPTNTNSASHSQSEKKPVAEDVRPYTSMIACNGTTTLRET